MEVRINREIRDYTESMFFGLSLRQFFFSVLACGIAVGIYLGLNPILGTETTSWLCIVAAFPFAVMGFLKYNGMTAEKLAAEPVKASKKRHYHRRGTRHKRFSLRKQTVDSKGQKKNKEK